MHSRNQTLLIAKWFLIALIFTCTQANPMSDSYSTSYSSESDNYFDVGDYVIEEPNDPNSYQCPGEPLILDVAKICDGFQDCLDGSDEDRVECQDNEPKKTEHAAAVYVRPPVVMKANTDLDMEYEGYDECDDSSQFECPSAKGLCIPLSSQCDGLLDCPDGEDELSCGVATTVENTPIPHDNSADSTNDYIGLRMYSPTESPTPSTLAHHSDSRIMIEDSNGKIEILSQVDNSRGPMARSNHVTEGNSFIPRLLVHVHRPRVQKVVEVYEDERGNAGLHQFIRHSSESVDGGEAPISPYVGETGETFVSESTKQRLESMSDLEAEEFLQSYAGRSANGNSQEELNLSSTEQQYSSLSPATEQTVATTTIILPSKNTLSRKTKKSKSHKKKVKGLLYKLMRQMGKLVTSKANDFDMDVNISLREIPAQATNSNDSTDSKDSTSPKQRRKPKVNLHLEMSL